MQQEDFIKRQIDQLGQALGKILADLIGLKSQGQVGDGIEAAGQALKNESGLNITDLVSIPAENLVTTLQSSRKMNADNFEKLADILFLLAEEPENRDIDNDKKREMYERSLTIYEYLDNTSATYSYDIHRKIEKIKTAKLFCNAIKLGEG
ncbi:MAG: hypothetical protein WCP32_03050 [Bacteroidota bacterium]